MNRIVGVPHELLRSEFEPISVDTECVRRMVQAGHGRLTEVGRDTLDRPLDLENCEWHCTKAEGIKTQGGMKLFGLSLGRRGRN
jgi:hypothetical protein